MRKIRLISVVMVFCVIFSAGSVYAAWIYPEAHRIEAQEILPVDVGTFTFETSDMPEKEISLVERLSDILNRKYETDIVKDSWDYLINETIQVYWEPGAAPYVGSMDKNFETQIDALFGDIIFDHSASFILKNQDLNWDGFSEIAMYSTSDPLDCVTDYDGVVCVYLTVFTPYIDNRGNILGYNLVCESMRGYCCEVKYSQDDPTPSFSTDEWRNDLGHYHHDGMTYKIPDNALSVDGTTYFKYDYNSYNYSYNYENAPWPGRTLPLGQKAWECLADKIPYLWW